MIEKKLSNATPLDDENVVLRRSDNNFLNKTQITNCILSAPNGVATYSGHTVTVKQGLKVLMPNGRNADGSLNNIEYVVLQDFNKDISSLVFTLPRYYMFCTNQNTVSFYSHIIISNQQPLGLNNYSVLWLNPETNIILSKSSSQTEFVRSAGAIIGEISITDGQISTITPYQSVELAKEKDIDGMWTNSEKKLLNRVSVTNTAGIHIDLSDYLPDDGHVYEVLCVAELFIPKNSAVGYRDLIWYSDLDLGAVVLAYSQVNTPPTTYGIAAQVNNFIQIVGPGRYMAYYRTSGYSAEMEVAMSVYGYRKVR